MAWVKLDDQFFINPKARAAGIEGRALAAASWCYCAAQRNDGIFPADDLPIIAAMAGVPQDIGDRLVEVGLWHRVGDQIEVHDYLEYNLSNEQIVARSKKASAAAAARHAPSKAASNATGRPPSNANALPIPSPSPDGSLSSSSTSDLDKVPSTLWTTMADKKVATATITSNAKGYRDKCIENAKADAELVARAVELHETFNLTVEHLADCLIGGTTPRAEYRRKTPA